MKSTILTTRFAGAIIFGLLSSFITASGTTITVTNTNDSGPGSLRQAVLDANSSSSITAISLAPIQNEAAPQAARILLESQLSLNSNSLSIIGDSSYPRPILESKDKDHRILSIASNVDGEILLRNLHFLNGWHRTIASPRGGAIYYFQGTSDRTLFLKVENCRFEGNAAGIANHDQNNSGRGGAIYFESRVSTAEPSLLRVWDSEFIGNRTLGTSSSSSFETFGHAICVRNSQLDLRGSYFEGNNGSASVSWGGTVALIGGIGGINFSGAATETASIRDCIFTLNGTEFGTGASGILMINYASNASRGNSSVEVNRSIFDGNGRSSSAPVISIGASSSGPLKCTLSVANSIFTLNQGAEVSVAQCRFNSELRFVHSTINNNWHYLSSGTAIFGRTLDSTLVLDRTVVAGNVGVGVTQNSTISPDVRLGFSSVLVSEGYNFIGSMPGYGSSFLDSTDQFSVDNNNPLNPMLGQYRDYGDGKWIIPPLPGGPLTEVIPGPYPLFGLLAWDIRSYERRFWNKADIGAVQLRRRSYNNWALLAGLPEGESGSPEADFSGDGISNSIAYLLGLDPLSFHPNPLQLSSNGAENFIEFVRSKRAGFDPSAENGISEWYLEVSSDLETWMPYTEAPVIQQTQPTSVELVHYRYPVDLSEETSRFFRLRVE